MTKLVALALPAGPDYVSALRRVWDEGNAIAPVDLRQPQALQQAVMASLGVNEVISPEGRSDLSAARVVEPGDALVLATSGTTGAPKGVVHTHESVAASARMTSAALGVTADDHWLACLPLAHIGGLSVVMRALLTETKLTVVPSFDVHQVRDLTRGSGPSAVTLVSLVNTALRRVDPAWFRRILLGGSAPGADRPANAVATYGMTETGSGVVYDNRVLPGVELRSDDAGQLWVRSPTLLRCYVVDQMCVDPLDADGWLATGDAGSVDSDGIVSVLGRVAEVIVTGGEKVWPAQVEAVLRTHPAIAEVLVTGASDPEWDEIVVATIEVREGAEAPSLDEVRDHVRAVLAPYCCPRRLIVTPRLERTASGKVKRRP